MWVIGPYFMWVTVSEALFCGLFWVGGSLLLGVGALLDNALSKCLCFTSNLETNSSKLAETGIKKKQFKFCCKIRKNKNLFLAQTPAWLPALSMPKIENLPKNSPGDFDCSLTDDNFFMINLQQQGWMILSYYLV